MNFLYSVELKHDGVSSLFFRFLVLNFPSQNTCFPIEDDLMDGLVFFASVISLEEQGISSFASSKFVELIVVDGPGIPNLLTSFGLTSIISIPGRYSTSSDILVIITSFGDKIKNSSRLQSSFVFVLSTEVLVELLSGELL